MIEQATCTYSTLGETFEKQIKIIQDQGRKQFEPLEFLKRVEHQQKPKSIEEIFQKDLGNNEIKNELSKIKKCE